MVLARPPDTPQRRSHLVPFKRSDHSCNLGGALRSSVKKKCTYRFVSGGLLGESLRYGGRLRFDLGEKAGLQVFTALKRLVNNSG